MAVIFDLDGTLLNSIDDLGNAMNLVLKRHNYPCHSMEVYKTFVGNGIRKLVERSLPVDIENFESLYEEYLIAYGETNHSGSYLYNDVYETLKKLNEMSIPIAIHTNKMQVYTNKIIKHYFSDIEFVSVVGDLGDGKRKPDPFHTQGIMDLFNTKEIFFVGDSDVDMKTAKNANCIAVGVSWGFRSVEELKREGAQYILESMSDLLALLD